MLHAEISVDPATLATICRAFGVSRLSVFGSALREDFDPSRSDVDMLVEFLPGGRPTLFTLVRLEDDLSSAFGRTVDLLTPGGLSKYLRHNILSSAEPIYVAP